MKNSEVATVEVRRCLD